MRAGKLSGSVRYGNSWRQGYVKGHGHRTPCRFVRRYGVVREGNRGDSDGGRNQPEQSEQGTGIEP
eukprot:5806399-Karenia_brevis.AAC.1